MITKDQLERGWKKFRPGAIPNVTSHRFVVERWNSNGTCIVLEPELNDDGSIAWGDGGIL